MSFDHIAPHYRWLEALFSRGRLQRARLAMLAVIPVPSRVLIYGEGNGRFLTSLRKRFPQARVTVVDASIAMLDAAARRLSAAGLDPQEVNFVHADALTWHPPAESFDLLVTHFFLDCFRADQLQSLIPQIAHAAKPQAQWLLADFKAPVAGCRGLRNRVILRLLYLSFRWATRLPARELTPPDLLLARAGFRLRQRQDFDWGLLHSDWWTREQ